MGSVKDPLAPLDPHRPADPHTLRDDALLAALMAVVAMLLALFVRDGRALDWLGWLLLLGSHVPLAWRRLRTIPALVVLIALLVPYHALDYTHTAGIIAPMIALYAVAVSGGTWRTALSGAGVIGITLVANASVGPDQTADVLQMSGWVVAVLLLGGYMRMHRQYHAAAVERAEERAERAERTWEEAARRRIAEERVRVARDLHDLLAHSITLIGVQTSVASHVMAADPDRLDRAAIAKALDDISETCRSARGELRTTLEVLRADGTDEQRGPLPGLDGLTDLARAARTAGARVELSVTGVDKEEAPPAVGAAAYRIVQEALTNAVRHAGAAELTVRVGLRVESGTAGDSVLRLSVVDDGAQPPAAPQGGGSAGRKPGFGLVGMRERARSVGGTLEAGPRPEGGFAVVAVLPLEASGTQVTPGSDVAEMAVGEAR